MERLPLGSIRMFAVVARLSSITRAAEELNVTPSAVSHQIRLLEIYLSTRLFQREKNKLQLTPEGRQYLTYVSEALSLLAGATKNLKARKPQQTLRIGSTPSFALLWLVKRLERFTKSHPEITLTLTAVPDPTAVLSDPFDVMIWYGSGIVHDRSTEPLGPNHIFPICKPSFLIGEHRLKTPSDLARCTLLDSSDDSYHRYSEPRQPSWTEWLHAADLNDVSARKYLYFTPRVLMQAAVAGGLGVGLTRSLLAVDALRANKIAIPFGPVLPHPQTYNLLYARRDIKRKEVGQFREWLHAEVAASTKKITRMLDKFTKDSRKGSNRFENKSISQAGMAG